MTQSRRNKTHRHARIKKAVNNRTRLELFLLLVLFIVAVPLSISLTRRISQNYDISTSVYEVSPDETAVEPTKVAAKVDFGRKIVTISPGQETAMASQVAALGGEVVDKVSDNNYVIKLPIDTLNESTTKLEESGTVSGVETDYPATIVTDTIDWGVDRVQAPLVWPTSSGGGVKVAILDTGADISHPELIGKIASTYNLINESTNVYDGHGHGTHVSGIVAAAKNESGYVGASHGASLMIGKVLGDDGVGYISDIIEGVNWAKNNGARVINMSLGSTYNSKSLEDAVNQAVSSGIVVVAAAGNTGSNMLYPAAYSAVLSVGATDKNDVLASFSARGANVVAPGVGITSSLPGSKYAAWSGTSMAAPHVAGVAALLIAGGETNPKSKIIQTAKDLGQPGTDYYYGAGLVNAHSSVNTKDEIVPLLAIISPEDGSSFEHGQIKLEATATDESGILEVIFAVDSQEVSKFSAGSQYVKRVNARDYAGVDHLFTVKAIDNAGNIAEVKVRFSVSGKTNNKPTKNTVQDEEAIPTGTNIEERDLTPEQKNTKKQSLLLKIWHAFFGQNL